MTVKKNSTSSISSPGSADSALDLNQSDLFGHSHSVNETSSAKPSSANTGLTFQSLTMSEPSQQMDLEELTSSRAAGRANLGVRPGSNEARKMTVTSGRKWLALLESYGHAGLLGKMCAALLTNQWGSSAAFLTWKASAMKPSHLLFQLAPLMPRTAETAFGLFLGTPTAAMSQRSAKFARKTQNPAEFVRDHPRLLHTPTATANQMAPSMRDRDPGSWWPTPVARDRKGLSGAGRQERKEHPKDTLPNAVGGALNPKWVEWLMGYPVGWTNLTSEELQAVSKTERHGSKPSVTRSSQVSSRKSGEQYLKRSVRE